MIIAGKEVNARLVLGTGKFNSNELMEKAIAVDGKMVKRPEWEGKELQEGAAILIIRASCGG